MQSGGDNSPLDADGTVLIQGAEIFTAGTASMDGSAQSSWFGSTQKYATSTANYSAGKIISTKTGNSGSVLFSYSLPKNVNYIMASYPPSLRDPASCPYIKMRELQERQIPTRTASQQRISSRPFRAEYRQRPPYRADYAQGRFPPQ